MVGYFHAVRPTPDNEGHWKHTGQRRRGWRESGEEGREGETGGGRGEGEGPAEFRLDREEKRVTGSLFFFLSCLTFSSEFSLFRFSL